MDGMSRLTYEWDGKTRRTREVFPTCRGPVTTTAGNCRKSAFKVASYFLSIYML